MSLSDAIVSRYWQWEVSLTDAQIAGDNVINNSDPSGMAFLIDPADGTTTQQGTVTSNQQILIPLWIAWCDDSEGSHLSLSDTARKKYNLGHIVSTVRFTRNGASVPVANLDVEVCKHGNSVTVTPPTPTPPVILNSTAGANEFPLTIASTSRKHHDGAVAGIVNDGPHRYAASDGFWAVISPSDAHVSSWSTGDTISYDTTVSTISGVAPPCETAPGSPNFHSTVTYTLSV
jgi:hypothetical protein